MIGTVTFKKFTGEKLPSISDYIKTYCAEHKEFPIEIIVGTDSQNKKTVTTYSTDVVL